MGRTTKEWIQFLPFWLSSVTCWTFYLGSQKLGKNYLHSHISTYSAATYRLQKVRKNCYGTLACIYLPKYLNSVCTCTLCNTSVSIWLSVSFCNAHVSMNRYDVWEYLAKSRRVISHNLIYMIHIVISLYPSFLCWIDIIPCNCYPWLWLSFAGQYSIVE